MMVGCVHTILPSHAIRNYIASAPGFVLRMSDCKYCKHQFVLASWQEGKVVHVAMIHVMFYMRCALETN